MEDLLQNLLDDMVETDTEDSVFTARCIITLKAFMSELKDINHYKPKSKIKVTSKLLEIQKEAKKDLGFCSVDKWTKTVCLYTYALGGRIKGNICKKKKTLPTVRHGGGSVMLRGYYSFSSNGKLHCVEGNVVSIKYQEILGENVIPSGSKPKP